MAKEREKGNSTMMIAISTLLALGAGGGVYYCYDEARKSEDLLSRSKDEYRKMAQYKRSVEEYVRSNKGRPVVVAGNDDPLLNFLDKKSREAQIPPGIFNIAKNAPSMLANWKEDSYTVTLQGTKEAPVKKTPVVDFLRKVEAERRSAKVKSLQLSYSGDEFRSATLTFSQFLPK